MSRIESAYEAPLVDIRTEEGLNGLEIKVRDQVTTPIEFTAGPTAEQILIGYEEVLAWEGLKNLPEIYGEVLKG